MNHEKFNDRLSFINSVLEDLGLTPQKIEPVDYDEDCPFPYNNFVYRVDFTAVENNQKANSPTSSIKPGTVVIPSTTNSAIIRLSNPAAGLNDTNRVENEVGMIALFRAALGEARNQLVPNIYGWSTAANGHQGWILQECMRGITLDQPFNAMIFKDKERILEQMAEILAALQNFELPSTITEFGGVRFDETGNLVSAPMTLVQGGPFPTYEAYYRKILHSALAEADANSLVDGWRPNGIRERLERFIAQKLDRIVQNVTPTRVLVHGDFTTNNLLFDPETMQLTAILDFDWSHIACPTEEFFRSFGNISGSLPGPYSDDSEELELRMSYLEGFPLVPVSISGEIQWDTAKAWDLALTRAKAQRPRTIAGIAEVSGLYWLADQIFPFLLCNEVVAGGRTKEQSERARERVETLLRKFLDDYEAESFVVEV